MMTTAHKALKRRTIASRLLLCLLAATLLATLPGALPVAVAGPRPEITAGGGASSQIKTWDFERFDTDIAVNTDGSLSVRETQIVNFTGSFSFLNRDLVTTSASFDDGRSYGRVRYKDIEVLDLNGQPYKDVKVQKVRGARRIHITFSATNEQKGWIIQYRVTGAMIYAKDYDRLYYNTVTSDRDVPIKVSRTTVTLPAETDMSKVKTTQYPDEAQKPTSLQTGAEGNTLWWETVGIGPYSTMTIDVSIPKGVIQIPTVFQSWFGALMIILATLMTVGIATGMILAWWLKGRDVGVPEIDVVRYEPPADLRPMEVAYLANEDSSTSDITAAIVDLAIRGKLVITEEGEKGLLKRKKFGFIRTGPAVDDLSGYEQSIMSGLFASGDHVTEDDLEDKFYTSLGTIYLELKDQVLSKDLFAGDPSKVKGRYYLVGALMILLIILFYLGRSWFDFGWIDVFIPALAISGLVVIIVGHGMSRRTAKGSEALSYVNGFKDYMETAEQEEMKFMTPENFQQNLPYAMVLGVADKWAEKFADIYTTPPDWYRGYGPYSTVFLVSSLSDMQSNVGSTLASSPSSSGSGGGGGFGGGSSGGGFGGGGSSAG